ncbi:MAG: glycogen/starch/alpha-glucan phosphorylase [Flavobacteriales bacterium]|nr:glycogen/starch/alpha-glucan phosphorylase [Flavobacteriales bacterium]
MLDYVRNKLRQDMTKRGISLPPFLKRLKNPPGCAGDWICAPFCYLQARSPVVQQPGAAERVAEHRQSSGAGALRRESASRRPSGASPIREIIHISRMPEFVGKIIFLEGYNMELAKLLVQGVDIWLNTPTRPKEASGTSGMKAALNGVLNLSVLDGWWAEGYLANAGWALPLEASYTDATLQDELDQKRSTTSWKRRVIPMYFGNGEEGFRPGGLT